MNTTQTLSRDDLLTDCERSMRYHQARNRFFGTIHQFILFVIFALASAGVSNLIAEMFAGDLRLWLLALVSMLALFSLVYNPADKASLHKTLHSRFARLTGDIAATADPDESTRTKWTTEVHMLYAEEPPVYRALNELCANQVAIKLGADKKYMADLKWHHRVLRNWIPFQGTSFSSQGSTS